MTALFTESHEKNGTAFDAEHLLSVGQMKWRPETNRDAGESLIGYRVVRVGDIVFEGHTAPGFPYGRFVLNDFQDGIASSRFRSFCPIRSMYIDFWKYLIHDDQVMRHILRRSTKRGTMMNELVPSDFLRQKVLVPSADEQRALGDFFTTLDSLISAAERQKELLELKKRAYLQLMFPQNGEKRPRLRFPGFTGDWEQRQLGDFARQVKTKNDRQLIQQTLTNSAEQGIVAQSEYFDRNITNKDSIGNYTIVSPDDFVYNPRISTSAPVGPINRNHLSVPGVVSPLYLVFSVDPTISHEYLEYFFKTRLWHAFMRLEGNSGARSDRFSISNSKFFRMPIWCPAMAEQIRIVHLFQTLDSLTVEADNTVKALHQLKQGYMQKMFI